MKGDADAKDKAEPKQPAAATAPAKPATTFHVGLHVISPDHLPNQESTLQITDIPEAGKPSTKILQRNGLTCTADRADRLIGVDCVLGDGDSTHANVTSKWEIRCAEHLRRLDQVNVGLQYCPDARGTTKENYSCGEGYALYFWCE